MMSALGQKQTSDCRVLMSALPPKADIRPRDQDVCLGHKQTLARPLDMRAQTLASPPIDEDYVPAPGMKQRIRVMPNLSV
jgi:hypothetical protein